MKKLLLSCLLIGLLFSCSKEEVETEQIESYEEFEILSTEIAENLDLNVAQKARIKESFTRNSEEADKPGFIWLIARHLSENLPAEDKDQISEQVQRVEAHLLEHGHCVPIGFEPNIKHPIHPTPDLLSQLLEPFQVPLFQELMQYHQQVSEQLIQQRIHDVITPQEFFAAMHTNRQQLMENIITNIFSDSQRVQLVHVIQHLHEERARYIENSYGCMIASLELEEETAQLLLSQIMSTQEIISENHKLLQNGEITVEEYLEALEQDCTSYQDNISTLLSEEQMDIVYLYRALSFRRF
ncbi:MAG: hypothetical protein HKN68_11325 [Saprospiraceae bacterium]|nr:hypothetical protein [Saprospiraceae bacterium]